jgi:hypothetical protein
MIHSFIRQIEFLYLSGHSLSRIHFHCSKYHIVATRLPPLFSQTKQQKQIYGFFSPKEGKISAAAGTLTATLHVRSCYSYIFFNLLILVCCVFICYTFCFELFPLCFDYIDHNNNTILICSFPLSTGMQLSECFICSSQRDGISFRDIA